VHGQLKESAKTALGNLDERFQKRTLPSQLSLGLVGGPGFSLNALIVLTAAKDGTMLPLASWGAGTRWLAALEVLEDVLAHHHRVVDEDADDQRQRHQRHHVDGEAHHIHEEEGGDHRGR